MAEQVRALLRRAADRVVPAHAPTLGAAVARLDEPLRVAVAGRVKAGKSTLLNALVGEAVAATDATECTTIVTVYRNGTTYRARLRTADGSFHDARYVVDDDRARIELDGHDPAEIDRLEVELPSRHLADVTLIDTPGVTSISESVSARTTAALTPASGDDDADVVVYLLRHLHQGDTDFLEAFSERAGRDVDPVRCIGVLARADELGNGRGDSLALARAVARRYAHDPRLAGRLSAVVPVSGLLAFTAATMRQRDFDALATLARMPVHELDLLTVSVDRFAAESAGCPVGAAERSHLLHRLGVFGIRFAVASIQAGATTSSALGEALDEASGIGPLRTLLAGQLGGRADSIKASRALDVLRSVLDPGDASTRDLVVEAERILANAHELREIRVLRRLQLGEIVVPDETRAALTESLGGIGTSPAARLGRTADVSGDELRAAATRRLEQLREARSAPLIHPDLADAYDAAVRSVEQVLVDVAPS